MVTNLRVRHRDRTSFFLQMGAHRYVHRQRRCGHESGLCTLCAVVEGVGGEEKEDVD